MDFTALHHFYWVVREGNFSKAARALQIAQPALSRAVQRLEETLNEDLLVRHQRHVELTAAGNTVFLECQLIFEAADRISELRGDQKRLVTGALRIGAGDIVAEHDLAAPLAEFMQRHGEVYPSVTVGPSGGLLGQIAAGDLDFGIFFHVPVTPEPLAVERLRSVPYRLVVSAKLTGEKLAAAMNSFIGSRELDSPDTRTYPTLEKLRKRHRKAAIRFSSNHLGLHKQMALAGAGVAILPEFQVREELKRRLLKDALPGEKFAFDLKLVVHRKRPLSPAAKAFLDLFRAAG